jgi:glycosyltransferase involved in cell wall biosynthesis
MNPPARDDKKLRILYVAYPLLPVSEHSAGGAEQVLWTLEREMHARGHRTTVAACSGSRVAGELFATGNAADAPDQFELRSQQQTDAVLRWLRAGAEFDLIHDMSGNFWQHTGGLPIPVLATLHLPRSLYTNLSFSRVQECVSFNCVSKSQMMEFSDLPRVLGVVPNGIALDHFPRELISRERREYVLWIGRICEEKGTHVALDVAHAAGEKLIIAGAVYPFLYHQKYFAREVIPRLKRAGSRAKYIERPSFAEKVDLIRNARAVLLTSEINETSSMVAMEAAACGTPVIAFRRGALPEVVAEGITGRLVNDQNEMVSALARLRTIEPEQCLAHAKENYSAARMAECYCRMYGRLLDRQSL